MSHGYAVDTLIRFIRSEITLQTSLSSWNGTSSQHGFDIQFFFQ